MVEELKACEEDQKSICEEEELLEGCAATTTTRHVVGVRVCGFIEWMNRSWLMKYESMDTVY